MKAKEMQRKKDRHYIVTTSSPSSLFCDGLFWSDDVVTIFFLRSSPVKGLVISSLREKVTM